MTQHKVSVSTVGPADTALATSLRVYIPRDIAKLANIEEGDTFDYRVVNNKLAIKYSLNGELVMGKSGMIHVKASAFLPPLRKKNTVQVPFVIKDGWLCVQVPETFEFRPKGFQLVEGSKDVE